jgi:hypothetical protein
VFFLGTVEGRPDRLSHEETHRVSQATFIAREAMVDTFRKCHEITLFDMDANPAILQITNVEKATSTQDVTNFFGVVNVLVPFVDLISKEGKSVSRRLQRVAKLQGK